jgi:hypothetical protein
MSKQQKHKDKMARRKAAKQAKAAQYKALAGTSKKTKNQGSKTAISSTLKHAHVMLNCGNAGCARCNDRKRLHGATGLGH